MIDLASIKLRSPYRVARIESCRIRLAPGRHGSLLVKALCEEGSVPEELIKNDGEDVCLLSGDGDTLFRGVTEEVEIRRVRGVCELTLKALTHSAEMDVAKVRRSFQDVEMSYGELIRKITDAYADSDFLLHADEKRPISSPLIQCDETDWEFLKRIAAHYNTAILPDHVGKGPRFHIGLPWGKECELPEDLPHETGMNTEAFREAGGREAGLDEFDFFFHGFRHERIFSLGDRVAFGNKRLRVTSVEAETERGELIFSHTAAREGSLYARKRFCENLRGLSLKGRIAEVRGERASVRLDIDAGGEEGKLFFFPYAPTTGNVLYCMPEPGTRAHLCFADEREESGMISDCVRENGETCAKTADPASRYLGTAHGKELGLLPGSLHLTDLTERTRGALRLALDESFGIRLSSHGNLRMRADGAISFSTPGFVALSAPSGIKAKAGLSEARALVSLEDAIHVYGEKSMLIGRDRSVYPPFDDDPARLGGASGRAFGHVSGSAKAGNGGGFNPLEAAIKAIAAVAVVSAISRTVAALDALSAGFKAAGRLFAGDLEGAASLASSAMNSLASAVSPSLLTVLGASAGAYITYQSDKRSDGVRSFGEYVGQAFAGMKVGHMLAWNTGKSLLENYTPLDFEDDTAVLEAIQEHFGEDLENLSDGDGALLGFNYDSKQGLFYASEHPWQRLFGYMDLYDLLFPLININIDREVFEFAVDYGNNNVRIYKIEFWKGQYGVSSGGEVGIYVMDKDGNILDYYDSVPKEEEIGMSFKLVSKETEEVLADTSLLAKTGDSDKANGFWEPVFVPGGLNKPGDLEMKITLTFPESMDGVEKAFTDSFEQKDNGNESAPGTKRDISQKSTLLNAGPKFSSGEGNSFEYDPDSGTAEITWSTAVTPRQTLGGVVAEGKAYVKGELEKGKSPAEILEDNAEFMRERINAILEDSE